MSLIVNINNITGSSPYDIYICQENGTGCFYIETISSVPYQFIIPPPYDSATSYMLKIIDNNNCIISGTTTQPTPTPTNTNTPTNTTTPSNTSTPGLSASHTPTITSTPTLTPTNTMTPTTTVTPGLSPTTTPTITSTPTLTPTNTMTPTTTVTPGLSPTATPTNTPTNTVTSSITPTNNSTPTPTPTETPCDLTKCSEPTNDCCTWRVQNLDSIDVTISYTACNSTELTIIVPFGQEAYVCSLGTPTYEGVPNVEINVFDCGCSIDCTNCEPYSFSSETGTFTIQFLLCGGGVFEESATFNGDNNVWYLYGPCSTGYIVSFGTPVEMTNFGCESDQYGECVRVDPCEDCISYSFVSISTFTISFDLCLGGTEVITAGLEFGFYVITSPCATGYTIISGSPDPPSETTCYYNLVTEECLPYIP